VSAEVSVRVFEAREWRVYRDLRLRALADAPDAFARTLAEEARLSDAEWRRRIDAAASSPLALAVVAEWEARPVGIAYGRVDEAAREQAHLFAMWVAPEARRQGAGRALVEAITVWARGVRARRVVLEVTRGNDAAARLYARAGFAPTGEVAPLRPGSPLRVETLALDLARPSPGGGATMERP